MQRRLGWLLSLILLPWTLGACATQGGFEAKPLPQNLVDNTYAKRTMRWTGTYRGLETAYYIKRFESNGMLAICALRVQASGGADNLAEDWFFNAFVAVVNAETRVARARFVASVPSHTPRSQWWANCIETETPATPRNLSAGIGFVGPAVERWD